MKRLFLLATIVVTLLSGGVAFAATPTDSARNQVCVGVNSEVAGSDCGGTTGQRSVNAVLDAVLSIISWIAGIAAIIMIVLAGLKYITSGGDSSQIASAKTSLIYALVGVVIVVLAQAIVFFIIHAATTPPPPPKKTGVLLMLA